VCWKSHILWIKYSLYWLSDSTIQKLQKFQPSQKSSKPMPKHFIPINLFISNEWYFYLFNKVNSKIIETMELQEETMEVQEETFYIGPYSKSISHWVTFYRPKSLIGKERVNFNYGLYDFLLFLLNFVFNGYFSFY